MGLAELLEIQPGVTAVIGSGGKTTLLRVLGEELAGRGHRVILTTTTKIFPFSGIPTLTAPTESQLTAVLTEQKLICVGTPFGDTGKLTAPRIPMARLAQRADYVLVESDGSASRPLKAHDGHEPVIPTGAKRTICVAGLSGFGKPIREAAHRPEIFAELAGVTVEDAATPESTAQVLRAEALADQYVFNQADTVEQWEWARRCGELLDRPWTVAALEKGVWGTCVL